MDGYWETVAAMKGAEQKNAVPEEDGDGITSSVRRLCVHFR
jgi:hypothetical protein